MDQTNPSVRDLIDLGAALSDPRDAVTVNTIDADARQFVMVPEGYKVQTFEHMMPNPWRKRANVTLRDHRSFTNYIAAQGGNVAIYGLRATGSFVAILDSNSDAGPGWQEHRATFAAQQTPEWKTWTGKSGVKLSQTDFALFIEDNLPDVVNPVGAEMLEMCRLLEAKKKVEFISGIRLSNGENELAYEETISGTVGKGKLPVPETFTIGISPFEGSDRFQVTARLRYRIGDDKKLVMWFDLDRPHKILEEAVKDIWTAIEAETSLLIYNGTP